MRERQKGLHVYKPMSIGVEIQVADLHACICIYLCLFLHAFVALHICVYMCEYTFGG